ncbi:hypothetical protein TD95_004897 [Thielaviopsis punctulata]|uniref:G-patch domain-containing protein n=1 Tax=Thielaviopsis punctulata TaxID=72032 RepID=A0A0F4Z8Y2_9PEZI|nr:hypothetical protein TD95_004897 [Thielaviopsis punctulata]
MSLMKLLLRFLAHPSQLPSKIVVSLSHYTYKKHEMKRGGGSSMELSQVDGAQASDTSSVSQRPEDFMDSEDLADAHDSRRLQTSAEFSASSYESPFVSSIGIGLQAVETAGSQLLRRMGWKPGQGIGPKVMRAAKLGLDSDSTLEACTSAQEFLFAPSDVKVVTFSSKSDIHGLGYGQDTNSRGTPSTTVDDNDVPHQMRLHMDASKAKSGKHLEERTAPLTGVALGEDSDDDLGPRISYSRGKNGKDAKKSKKPPAIASRKPVTKRNPNLFSQDSSLNQAPAGFVLPLRGPSQMGSTRSGKFDPPEVPHGWTSKLGDTSVAVADESQSSMPASAQTPQNRGIALGEQQLPSQSIFDFISPEARARLALISGKTNLPMAGGKSVPLSSSGISTVEDIYTQSPSLDRESALAALTRASTLGGPYHNDEAKLARYTAYLKFHANQIRTPILPPGQSLAELKIELAEFYNCARIFKPMTGFMATRFAPSSNGNSSASSDSTNTATKSRDAAIEAARIGMHGNLTRSVLSFSPSRILYKRFSLPIPAHFQADNSTEPCDGSKSFPKSDREDISPLPRANDQDAGGNNTKPVTVIDRPSDDVFRSIFGGTSSTTGQPIEALPNFHATDDNKPSSLSPTPNSSAPELELKLKQKEIVLSASKPQTNLDSEPAQLSSRCYSLPPKYPASASQSSSSSQPPPPFSDVFLASLCSVSPEHSQLPANIQEPSDSPLTVGISESANSSQPLPSNDPQILEPHLVASSSAPVYSLIESPEHLPSQLPDASEPTVSSAPRDVKPESSKKDDESEPPPAYSEGSSPLLSFTYVMAAAGGPSSLITQVQQGGAPIVPVADVGADETISMDLRGTRFVLSRDELLTLPEFVLLSLFPNGLFPDGQIGNFDENDAISVDYDPASLDYMLEFFRKVAQSIPAEVSDNESVDAMSTREDTRRAGIIVLREDLDFYVIPPRANIAQEEMLEVKRAASRVLLKQDGIFSGLKRSDEPGTTEAHLIEMLTAGGFNHDDRWGHRAGEPNKTVICSLALARLRSDIRGNDVSNNAVGMAQKLLLFWRKPARRCWWEGVELQNVDGVEGTLKVWIRRVWTLEMSVIGLR